MSKQRACRAKDPSTCKVHGEKTAQATYLEDLIAAANVIVSKKYDRFEYELRLEQHEATIKDRAHRLPMPGDQGPLREAVPVMSTANWKAENDTELDADMAGIFVDQMTPAKDADSAAMAALYYDMIQQRAQNFLSLPGEATGDDASQN